MKYVIVEIHKLLNFFRKTGMTEKEIKDVQHWCELSDNIAKMEQRIKKGEGNEDTKRLHRTSTH